MANYTYPHLEISTTALKRRTVASVESTATTLLAPFKSDRGPENKLVAIDTMAQFINTYGELDKTVEGQEQILNIGNWIIGGGRVLACRMIPTHEYPVFKEIATGSYGFYKTGDSQPTASVSITFSKTSTDSKITYFSTFTVDGTAHRICLEPAAGYEYTDLTDACLKEDNALNYFEKDVSGDVYKLKATTSLKLVEDEIYIVDADGGHSVRTYITVTMPTAVPVTITKASGKSPSYGTAYSFRIEAKYTGTYYSKLRVEITPKSVDSSLEYAYFDILVKEQLGSKVTRLEKFSNVSFDKLFEVSKSSSYIGNIYLQKNVLGVETEIKYLSDVASADVQTVSTLLKKSAEVILSGAQEDSTELSSYMIDQLRLILAQPLETPFDTFIDCGYSKELKLQLIKLFCGVTDKKSILVRNDSFLVLTNKQLSPVGDDVSTSELRVQAIDGLPVDLWNMTIVDHVGKTIDIYSKKSGREIKVPLTYAIAALYPYNDAKYGVQYATAGLNRGVIPTDIYDVEGIPSDEEKQEHYDAHLNYIERDTRGQYLMSDLTGSLDDTALIYVKNARALLKIKKELTAIGRQYLHELNDRVTKSNLSNALNLSLANWIQNRTLTYGSVYLEDSADDPTLTDEQIAINLNIKFTNSINIISTNIVVE